MVKSKIKLGLCPTRRDVFSVKEAIRLKNELVSMLSKRSDIDLVTIDDINKEGLLFGYENLNAVIEHMKKEKVEALFFPHCNFGTEDLVAEVARALNVPVLIWGPRDDAPLENGFRTRDSQCGMFATGKVLQRYGVKFTYLNNSDMESDYFQAGLKRFIRVANVVKTFRATRILQISTRPTGFNSVTVNEGEILEKFGIRLYPVALSEVTDLIQKFVDENSKEFNTSVKFVMENISKDSTRENIEKMIGLKMAIKYVADQYNCNAAAIQCWNALQDMTGIMPCLANSLLGDEGFPCVCETDIHGAISSLMLQAATMDENPVFFADLTVRDRKRDNVELLWHCGPFPYSMAKDKSKATAGSHWILESGAYGTCEWEIEQGDITVCRFDGVNGKYQLLVGEGKGVDGPFTRGTYVWFEVNHWPTWEKKLVEGPYIHHISGVYGKHGEVLTEATKYINDLALDAVEPSAVELEGRWVE